MTIRRLLALGLLMGMAGPVWGQEPVSGGYLSLSGMATLLDKTSFSDGDVLPSDAKAEFETGWGASVAGGAKFASLQGVRAELELAFRTNKVDQLDTGGATLSIGDDIDIRSAALMLNAAYDFDVIEFPLRPYLMAGAGWAVVFSTGDAGTGADSGFAYQLGGGLQWSVTPHLVLFAGYRYFATSEMEVQHVKFDYDTHNLEGGLRVFF